MDGQGIKPIDVNTMMWNSMGQSLVGTNSISRAPSVKPVQNRGEAESLKKAYEIIRMTNVNGKNCADILQDYEKENPEFIKAAADGIMAAVKRGEGSWNDQGIIEISGLTWNSISDAAQNAAASPSQKARQQVVFTV